MGPTGISASLIGGTTLHSGLDFRFGSTYCPLSDQKRDQFRKEFEELEVSIIGNTKIKNSLDSAA